jgi:A/G-specific adenine glycosylase
MWLIIPKRSLRRMEGSSSEVLPLVPEELSSRLLAWYDREQRRLPWRGHPDAYAVWVSEIMLQQTRVETVIPYFERWMQRFPTITSLARASQQEVLSLWEGLGYYSRARNLHKAAQVVDEQYAGQLPQDRTRLEKLPGIGAYTAGAIASIAFGRDEAALDGNIRRVLARVFAVRTLARSPAGEKELWNLARRCLPPGRAGDYNQALMDLGSAICTPRSPQCLLCPLLEICAGRKLGLQETLPILAPRQKVPHLTVAAAVIRRENTVLIAQRAEKDLLGGMWEFPGGTLESGETIEEGLQREIHEELNTAVHIEQPFGTYNHAYTHFSVTLHAFLCRLAGPEPQAIEAKMLRWVLPGALADFPLGKIDRLIANRLEREPWQ